MKNLSAGLFGLVPKPFIFTQVEADKAPVTSAALLLGSARERSLYSSLSYGIDSEPISAALKSPSATIVVNVVAAPLYKELSYTCRTI